MEPGENNAPEPETSQGPRLPVQRDANQPAEPDREHAPQRHVDAIWRRLRRRRDARQQ